MKGIALEVIAVTVADAVAAEQGGADRIELVDDLAADGTTPAIDIIRNVKRAVSIPVYVMIRARAGDFVYSKAEVDVMVEQARLVADTGADGIVTGALTEDGTIDTDTVTRIVEAANVPATFHRAFDELRADKMPEALAQLSNIPLLERVLTSGGCESAFEGRRVIAELVDHCQLSSYRSELLGGGDALRAGRGKFSIMPGGGVTLANVAQLVAHTGVREVHVGTSVRRPHKPTAPVSATRSEGPSRGSFPNRRFGRPRPAQENTRLTLIACLIRSFIAKTSFAVAEFLRKKETGDPFVGANPQMSMVHSSAQRLT